MILEILIGFVVGILIALTGIGGGALLMPILLFLGIPPLTAVGTDILFNFVTKAWSVFLHFTKNLQWKILIPLSIGVLVANVISHFVFDSIEQQLIFFFVIIILLLGASLNLYRFFKGKNRKIIAHAKNPIIFVIFGLIISFIVNLTSVGVGILLTLLLLYFTDLSEKNIIKIDLAFGFIATLFGSFLHFGLGTIDYTLAALLITGSIPGAYIGYKLHNKVDGKQIRFILTFVILIATIVLLLKKLVFV